jgi:hypothetical protein
MTVPGAFAQALVITPEQTEGSYYPITLPLDTDNDLLVINSNITPAIGRIAYFLVGIAWDSEHYSRGSVMRHFAPVITGD